MKKGNEWNVSVTADARLLLQARRCLFGRAVLSVLTLLAVVQLPYDKARADGAVIKPSQGSPTIMADAYSDALTSTYARGIVRDAEEQARGAARRRSVAGRSSGVSVHVGRVKSAHGIPDRRIRRHHRYRH
ncbi:hypothetical protein [Bradyrhizobium cenepequi]